MQNAIDAIGNIYRDLSTDETILNIFPPSFGIAVISLVGSKGIHVFTAADHPYWEKISNRCYVVPDLIGKRRSRNRKEGDFSGSSEACVLFKVSRPFSFQFLFVRISAPPTFGFLRTSHGGCIGIAISGCRINPILGTAKLSQEDERKIKRMSCVLNSALYKERRMSSLSR